MNLKWFNNNQNNEAACKWEGKNRQFDCIQPIQLIQRDHWSCLAQNGMIYVLLCYGRQHLIGEPRYLLTEGCDLKPQSKSATLGNCSQIFSLFFLILLLSLIVFILLYIDLSSRLTNYNYLLLLHLRGLPSKTSRSLQTHQKHYWQKSMYLIFMDMSSIRTVMWV